MKLCMGCMDMYEDKFDMCPNCGYEENSLPEEAFHLTPGTIVGERYLIGKVLGFGGFGVTYIGYDKELEKKVAIKEYLPSEFASRTLHQTKLTVYGGEKTEQFEQGMEKFIEEARKLAKFNQDTEIVNVYDTFMENNTAYIIMEYLEGESLKELLVRKGKLSLEETEQIILPIFRSIGLVHNVGIIHRDIAPDNIFITKDGRVKLLDFGAARYASATHSRSLTVIYKPGYAPKEQYQSRGEQGPWTDVYALAATIYKCLTGETPDTSLERKVKDTLKKPSKMGVDIPVNKETALLNAMNIEIKSRTKSAEAFLQEWESRGVVERIQEKFEKMDAGKLSKKTKTGFVVATLGVVAALAVLITMGGSQNITDAVYLAKGTARVPSIINEDVIDAQAIAGDAGIRIEQEDVAYSSEIPKDKILTQSYAAGTVVENTEPLRFVVSGGARQIYMPEIIGLSLEAAKKLLQEAGFEKVEEAEEYSSETPGTVFWSDLNEGMGYDYGTVVTLHVSKGIEPVAQDNVITYEVPDVVGMTEEELKTIIQQHPGIYLDSTDKVYTGENDKGMIIAQKTAVGTVLSSDDLSNNTLYVTVSQGIEMARVPQLVIGKKYEDVVSEMEALGFEIGTKEERNDATMGKGLVISMSTDEGINVEGSTELPKGTKIHFVVSKGAEAQNHVHNYKESVITQATCTNAGTIKGVCATCSDEYTKAINAKGHQEVIESAVAATCTTAGKTEKRYCTVCGVVTVEAATVNAKGHVEIVEVSAVSATCTTAGKTEGKKCAVCGVITQQSAAINATGHTEIIDKAVAATCTTDGKTEGKHCSICGSVIVAQQSIGAAGHVYNSDTDIDCNTCGYARGYWSEWSDWGTYPYQASELCQVETREVPLDVTKTRYQYRRCVWYNSAGTYVSSRLAPSGYVEGSIGKGKKTYGWDYTGWYDTQIPCVLKEYTAGVQTTTYDCGGTTYYTEIAENYVMTEQQTQYRYRQIVWK